MPVHLRRGVGSAEELTLGQSKEFPLFFGECGLAHKPVGRNWVARNFPPPDEKRSDHDVRPNP